MTLAIRIERVKNYFLMKKNPKGWDLFVLFSRKAGKTFFQIGIYQAAVNYCRSVESALGNFGCEYHHIDPLFAGGFDVKQNKLRVTYENHCYLHFLRWIEFGDIRDLCAGTLRVENIKKGFDPQKYGQTLNKMNKELRRGWYNSSIQANLGKRGGRAGGAKNTPAQQAVRKNHDFAVRRGRGNQGVSTKFVMNYQGEKISQLWYYKTLNSRFYLHVVTSYFTVSDQARTMISARQFEGEVEIRDKEIQAIRNALTTRGQQAGWFCCFMFVSFYCEKTLTELHELRIPDEIFVPQWNLNVIPHLCSYHLLEGLDEARMI